MHEPLKTKLGCNHRYFGELQPNPKIISTRLLALYRCLSR